MSAADMITVTHGEASEKVAGRVLAARQMQAERIKQAMADPELAARLKSANGFTNASASSSLFEIIKKQRLRQGR